MGWPRVMEVNLHAAARLTRQLIPSMVARGGGSVVLMSSIAGLRGNGAIGLYGLSKAALAQLARAHSHALGGGAAGRSGLYGVVALLVSRAGGFVSGQNVVVDGGTTISDGS